MDHHRFVMVHGYDLSEIFHGPGRCFPRLFCVCTYSCFGCHCNLGTGKIPHPVDSIGDLVTWSLFQLPTQLQRSPIPSEIRLLGR